MTNMQNSNTSAFKDLGQDLLLNHRTTPTPHCTPATCKYYAGKTKCSHGNMIQGMVQVLRAGQAWLRVYVLGGHGSGLTC